MKTIRSASTLTVFFIILLFILFLNSCKNRERIKRQENMFHKLMILNERDKSLVMAHRGRPGDNLPENAIESFDSIYALSKDIIIEFDVRQTKDGTLVLMHDETLDRTTTGNGRLSEKHFIELSRFKLITNKGDTTAFTIPTYQSVLNWAKGKNFLAIDAKPGTNLELIVEGIEQYGLLDRVMIICYSIEDAEHYLKLNSKLILAIGFNSVKKLKEIKHSSLPTKNLVALTPTTLQKKNFYDQIRELNIPVAFGTYTTLDTKDLDTVKNLYMRQAREFDILTTDKAENVFKLLHR